MRKLSLLLLATLLPLTVAAQRLVPKGGERLVGSVRRTTASTDVRPLGAYSFPATTQSTEWINLSKNNYYLTDGAGTYTGEYFMTTSWSELWGSYLVFHYLLDTETWQPRGQFYGWYGTIATDITYCAVDDRMYGCFYNDDLDGYVFGYLVTSDSGEWDRVALADLSTPWVGVAAHPDGTIYALTADGNLLTADRATGALTVIGSTGLQPGYVASATISPETEILYWNFVDKEQKSFLYSVDLHSAAPTLIYEMPADEVVYGMYVPTPLAEDEAPAAPEDLTCTFDRDALEGTFRFGVPSETYSGETLTGDVAYLVRANGTLLQTGSVQAGSTAEISVSVPTIGAYEFALTLKNAYGEGPKATQTLWVGHDTPDAPTEVAFTYDEAAETSTLTWTAPTSSRHGGWVDWENLTYNVVRWPDARTVATGLRETSFSEALPLPQTLTNVFYTVSATAQGATSATGTSNTLALGYLTPPWTEDFSDADVLAGWRLLNLNDPDDYYGFSHYVDDTDACLRCMYSKTGENNDWAISPGVRLEGGKMYRFSVDLKGYKEYENDFCLHLLTAQDPEAIHTTLIPKTAKRHADWRTYSADYVVPEGGIYYLALQECSPYNLYTLYADNFSITEGVNVGAPGAPTELTAVPDALGGREVQISFRTPTLTANGGPLSGALTKAEVYRDGVLAQTFDAPAMGETLSFTDVAPAGGYITYQAVCHNSSGAGTPASVRCFVGANIPAAPSGVQVTETLTEGTVSLTWTAPDVDIDGAALSPDILTYDIVMVLDGKESTVATGVEGTAFTYEVQGVGEAQKFVYFTVSARSAGGKGEAAASGLIPVGAACGMTFSESFAGSALRYPFGTASNGYAAFASVTESSLSGVSAQDGDDGLLRLQMQTGGCGWFYFPKVLLSGSHPELSFFTRTYTGGRSNNFSVYLIDGNDETLLASLTDDDTSWKEHVVDLTQWSGKTVRLYLYAEYGGSSYTLFDNFHIRQQAEANLSLYASQVPECVYPQTPFHVAYTVENVGSGRISKYEADLLQDGEVVATQSRSTIAAGDLQTFSFPVTLDASQPSTLRYAVRLRCPEDEFPADNVSDEMQVVMITPSYPAVTDLSGSLTSEGYALEWSALPTACEVTKARTEDFESYASFATDHVGDWTLIDGDGDPCGAINGYTLGVEDQPVAFFVFDAAKNSKFPEAYSGTKMMCSMFTKYETPQDDWLITPRLSGAAQHITFWARSYAGMPETFEMLYSTTDTAPSSFHRISTVAGAPSTYTEYGALVPEGAQYFAIRCISQGQFWLFVDDVTFTPAEGEMLDLNLRGYNVYRNHVRLNDAPLAEPKFCDTGIDADAMEQGVVRYCVTAVYDQGESARSNELVLIPTGVGGITVGPRANADVFDLSGRRAPRNAKGVLIVGGRKILVSD